MTDQSTIYLSYLLDEQAKVMEDPSSKYFLHLAAKYIRKEAALTEISATFMYPGYKVTQVSIIETNN